jgi:hypothetical protein
VQLPVDKEHNEQVVGVPEPFKVLSALGLSGGPRHSTKTDPHDPASDGWTSLNTEQEEVLHSLAGIVCGLDGKVDNVDNVCEGVDE